MIDEDLKKDIYDYSTGDCWYSWAKQVGVSTKTWHNQLDLTTWETCPRNGCPEWVSHANGRICAAHHLMAGPRHKISQNSINFCTCTLSDLMTEGCSCGGE